MKYPEIVIKDAWLLRENASRYLHELWGKPGEKLAGDEEMEQIVKSYQDAWKPLEKTILTGMCQTFDLEFRHNIIDVYIAPWFYGFSDPLVVGVTNEPDKFVDILTHELFHRLFTANTKYDIDKSKRRLEWQKIFGKEHDFTTLVHIPVHAGLKAIYIDVLEQPYRLERDIKDCQKRKSYKAAWDYVEKHDYKEIIQQLKDSYSQ